MMRRAMCIAMIGGVVLLAGCKKPEAPASATKVEQPTSASENMTAEERILASTERLLDCDFNVQDCYANITETSSGRTVSVGGNIGSPLVISLGLIDKGERDRGGAFFSQFEEAEIEDSAFVLLTLDRDAQETADVVIRIFREVFQIEGDLDLRFDEQ